MPIAAPKTLLRDVRRAVAIVGCPALALLAYHRFCKARQDRRVKTLARIAPPDVLERLASLPIYIWRYRFQPTIPHIGSTAQDFYERFGLGDSPRRVFVVDAIGVAYAAIIALYEQVRTLSEEWKRARPLLERIAAEQAATHREEEE